MIWYLVMANLYIGPFTEDSCKRVERYIPAMCKQPNYIYVCKVEGTEATYTTCPAFDLPEVIIK